MGKHADKLALLRRDLKDQGYKYPTEICRDKGLSINTIAQWKRRHKATFPKDYLGMYHPADIDKWLELRATWTKDSRLVRGSSNARQ